MKISVMSYTFVRQFQAGKVDLFTYLEMCKYRFRLGAADIWNGMLVSMDEEYLAKVKDGLAERGLVVANLAFDGPHIWDDDPEVREQHYQLALKCLDTAEYLGAKTVRIDAGGARDVFEFTPEQFDLVVARYQEYAKRAQDNGYLIGPENHWGPTTEPNQLKKVCEAVDNPAFGITAHLNRWKGPDADKGDEIIVPWMIHTHFSGRNTAGIVPVKMQLLRDAGYKGYYGLESPSTNNAVVAKELDEIRSVLEQWRQEA